MIRRLTASDWLLIAAVIAVAAFFIWSYGEDWSYSYFNNDWSRPKHTPEGH